MLDLRMQFLFDYAQLRKQAQGLLRRFLIQLRDGKTNMDDRVIADGDFRHIGETHLFDDAGEVNPAHADAIGVENINDSAWNAKAHSVPPPAARLSLP
jgi:hypothetical protein